MSREIRRVSKNWEHPRTFSGQFQPLCDDYIGSLKYYKEGVDEFINRMTEVIQKGKVKVYKEVFTDVKKLYKYLIDDEQMNPPDINDFMPNGEWYQLFETVSEGTPLSPPFATKEELVEWLVNNKDYWGHQWTRPQAEGMVKFEYVPSMIMTNGRLYTSEEVAEFQSLNKE